MRIMSDNKVLVLLGSLRAASVNRQLVELAVESAPDGVTLVPFDRLGELPFYNEDIDNDRLAPKAHRRDRVIGRLLMVSKGNPVSERSRDVVPVRPDGSKLAGSQPEPQSRAHQEGSNEGGGK